MAEFGSYVRFKANNCVGGGLIVHGLEARATTARMAVPREGRATMARMAVPRDCRDREKWHAASTFVLYRGQSLLRFFVGFC